MLRQLRTMIRPILVASSVGSPLRRLLLLPLMILELMTHSCGGIYSQQRVALSRGVRGYVDCPALAEPPATLIVWTKDGEVVDTENAEGGRSTDSRGSLVIDRVSDGDDGLYYCSAYSPLDDLRTDYPIWVSVKGQCGCCVGQADPGAYNYAPADPVMRGACGGAKGQGGPLTLEK